MVLKTSIDENLIKAKLNVRSLKGLLIKLFITFH